MKVKMLKDVVVAVLQRRVFVGEVVEVGGSTGMDLVNAGAAVAVNASADSGAVYKQEVPEKSAGINSEKQAGKRPSPPTPLPKGEGGKKQVKRAIMGGK